MKWWIWGSIYIYIYTGIYFSANTGNHERRCGRTRALSQWRCWDTALVACLYLLISFVNSSFGKSIMTGNIHISVYIYISHIKCWGHRNLNPDLRTDQAGKWFAIGARYISMSGTSQLRLGQNHLVSKHGIETSQRSRMMSYRTLVPPIKESNTN